MNQANYAALSYKGNGCKDPHGNCKHQAVYVMTASSGQGQLRCVLDTMICLLCICMQQHRQISGSASALLQHLSCTS